MACYEMKICFEILRECVGVSMYDAEKRRSGVEAVHHEVLWKYAEVSKYDDLKFRLVLRLGLRLQVAY